MRPGSVRVRQPRTSSELRFPAESAEQSAQAQEPAPEQPWPAAALVASG